MEEGARANFPQREGQKEVDTITKFLSSTKKKTLENNQQSRSVKQMDKPLAKLSEMCCNRREIK